MYQCRILYFSMKYPAYSQQAMLEWHIITVRSRCREKDGHWSMQTGKGKVEKVDIESKPGRNF
jgi:hypothetical protein